MKNHSLALGALVTALALMSVGCHKKEDSGQAGTEKSMDTMPQQTMPEQTMPQQTAPQVEQAPAEMAKPATPPSSEMPQGSYAQPPSSEMPQGAPGQPPSSGTPMDSGQPQR